MILPFYSPLSHFEGLRKDFSSSILSLVSTSPQVAAVQAVLTFTRFSFFFYLSRNEQRKNKKFTKTCRENRIAKKNELKSSQKKSQDEKRFGSFRGGTFWITWVELCKAWIGDNGGWEEMLFSSFVCGFEGFEEFKCDENWSKVEKALDNGRKNNCGNWKKNLIKIFIAN